MERIGVGFFKKFMRECQREIRDWLIDRIQIPEQFQSIENRSQRFLEEALELVQVTGLSVWMPT